MILVASTVEIEKRAVKAAVVNGIVIVDIVGSVLKDRLLKIMEFWVIWQCPWRYAKAGSTKSVTGIQDWDSGLT